MNIISLPKKISYFLLAGLLIISLTLFLSRFATLPDFARGALIGVGIGMEIIALNRLASYRKTMRATENQ
ncbi:hypothetical protein [Mucilaginibacter sp. 21P]|uniref:hypothetical protein n=1 Tax=Mucilaginibacter sp. 21P TaxID=2778902 RepID=UPI001C570840|nr:hypothetical protein [Mucilaginibacter sp. 21P]